MTLEIDPSILQHYEVKRLQGSGSYGHVWKCIEKETGKEVALKKIFDAFHNDTDAQRTYREITMLHELEHANIIKLHKVMKAKNKKDLYLVFDFMEADLQSLIGENVLQNIHIKFVIYQILKALKYLHSAQLIHRDLKPSNILINSQCESIKNLKIVKVCDFGLARSLTCEEGEQIVLSEEVATRWYRSPEMLLGSSSYGKKTDVWSLGCIIAELIMGEPIFSGDSTITQLEKILEFTGIPSRQSIDSIKSKEADKLINQINVQKKAIKSYFKSNDKDLISLAEKMLEFNPNLRITVDEAIEHQMFKEFRTSEKKHEDICKKFIIPCQDDNVKLSIKDYRQIIYSDIDRRYPQNKVLAKIKPLNLMQRESKENKRELRTHKSFHREKSLDVIRQNNYSVHAKLLGKENCSSLYQPEEVIKRLKKTVTASYLYGRENKYHNIGGTQTKKEKNEKTYGIISNANRNFEKDKNPHILAKVRSRKILVEIEGKEKMERWGVI